MTTSIDQLKANILARATLLPELDCIDLARQSRMFTARLTVNWFLYGKRGITLKFNRYNPFME